MPTVAEDLDWCQGKLGDAATLGQDGQLWTRADLLTYYSDGYRKLLSQSQAVCRFTILDVPGRFTASGTAEWESRHTTGSFWKWTWTADSGTAECSSPWEAQFLEGVTPQASGGGVTQEWERAWLNPTHLPYRFALPRDNERIAGMWYDNRRLEAANVCELDQWDTHWMSLGDYPMNWTQGTGRTRTFEIFEIVTTYSQGYSSNPDGGYGIPRRFSGVRTYTTADSELYGIPRSILSPDRQYLVTTDMLGRPTSYHTSEGSLLLLEVIGAEIPDLQEEEIPDLIPPQLQKYLKYYTLKEAWEKQGEGFQAVLAAICEQRFLQGVQVLKKLGWLTRKDHHFVRQPVDGQHAAAARAAPKQLSSREVVMHWIDLDQDWGLPAVQICIARHDIGHQCFITALQTRTVDAMQALVTRICHAKYPGAVVVAMGYDSSSDCLYLTCVHPTFPRNEPGTLLPRWRLEPVREDAGIMGYALNDKEQ